MSRKDGFRTNFRFPGMIIREGETRGRGQPLREYTPGARRGWIGFLRVGRRVGSKVRLEPGAG